MADRKGTGTPKQASKTARKRREAGAAGGSITGSLVVDEGGAPVAGVEVAAVSLQRPEVDYRGTTDADGRYRIGGLPPGTYKVEIVRRVVTHADRRWEPTIPSMVVEVGADAAVAMESFRLREEEHLIDGVVQGPDAEGVAGANVEVYRQESGTGTWDFMETLATDEAGVYRYQAPEPGSYRLRFLDEHGDAVDLVNVDVGSPINVPFRFSNPFRKERDVDESPPPVQSGEAPPPGGGEAPPSGGGSGRMNGWSALPSTNDFPILTEEIDLGQAARPTLPRSGTRSADQTVEQQLRDVLGWRPRAGDAKGFLAALDQAFTCEEVEGHTECRWTPRSYAVEVRADMGAITGAQASIYNRAKATLDDALPLLDGLKPLIPDYDPENVTAIRAIVRTQLTELVEELGVEGGPRVARVNQLFDFLLGPPSASDEKVRDFLVSRVASDGVQDLAQVVGGNLGALRDRFGLRRGRINTIDEEQNYTNFLIVVEYVITLETSWLLQIPFFTLPSDDDRGPEPYLGTRLVLLSRDLEVVGESVHEVEFAMNSVFLGPTERQTMRLRFPTSETGSFLRCAGYPSMFVADLLGWVERFATEEGPQLIEVGGKQGLANFRDTAELLECLVRAARTEPAGLQATMPAAYARPRVQRALDELATQLRSAADDVGGILAPEDDSDGSRLDKRQLRDRRPYE
jgi:hypothetical protein